MGHHALLHGEDVSEEMVEERHVMHEMHAGAEDDQQDRGDDGFFAGHNDSRLAPKIRYLFCNPVAI